MPRSFFAWSVPTALLLLGFSIFLFSVVLAPPAATVGQAAAPWPDGAEYLDAAVSLVREGACRIHVGAESQPPRYPCGYSLLTAAALTMGVDAAMAPHRVNLLAGLLLLLLTAAYLWRSAGPFASGLGVVLLATLPAFVLLCKSPLSEVSGTVVAVSGVWLLYGYSRRGTLHQAVLGGFLLALAVCFRISNVLLLVFFVLAALVARHGRRWRQLISHLPVLGAAAFVGLVPLFVYNWINLGSPLATGYDYWAPYWGVSRAFQLRFVVPNLIYYGRELVQQETLFTTASVYGGGSYFGPSFVLLTLLAPWGLRTSRCFWCFVAAAVAYAALMLFYFFPDARLLFPLFVLAVPVAASATAAIWRRQATARVLAAATVALFLCSAVGWPSPDRSPELVAFFERASPVSPAYRVTRKLQRLRTASPRLVLTDLPPPYVHAISVPGTLVAPLYDDHLFRFHPEVFTFSDVERRRLVTEALASGRPVWAVVHAHDILDVPTASPAPRGYVWEIVAREEPASGIARLVSQ